MTINLLPPQIKKEKQIAKALAQFSLVLAAILLLVSMTGAAFYAYNGYLDQFLRRTKDRIEEENTKIKTLKNVEESVKTINGKLSLLEAKENERLYFSSVLDRVSANTPKAIEIKSLNIIKESLGATITGSAISRTDIALMKEKMEASGYFKNVTFTSSTYTDATSSYSFSLTFEIIK